MLIEDRFILGWRRVVRFFERFTGPFYEENGRIITYSEMTPEQRRAFDRMRGEMSKVGEALMDFGRTLVRTPKPPPRRTGWRRSDGEG